MKLLTNESIPIFENFIGHKLAHKLLKTKKIIGQYLPFFYIIYSTSYSWST